MRIHTLGPDSSDSYVAAKSILQSEEDDVIDYPSFDSLIHNIRQLREDYVLFPVAFQSARKEYGWKEFNYDYWDRVELIQVFSKKTKPMLLVKNRKHTENKAMIHPATEIFMKKYLKSVGESTVISYTDSKYKAWTAFYKKKLKYTIVSEDVYEKEKQEEFVVEERYEPEMVWCLYKIK